MLKYIGNGAFVQSVPARDLTDEEVLKFGETMILATGLYEKVDEQPKPTYDRKGKKEAEKWPTE